MASATHAEDTCENRLLCRYHWGSLAGDKRVLGLRNGLAVRLQKYGIRLYGFFAHQQLQRV